LAWFGSTKLFLALLRFSYSFDILCSYFYVGVCVEVASLEFQQLGFFNNVIFPLFDSLMVFKFCMVH
jgi:hypothetical protein